MKNKSFWLGHFGLSSWHKPGYSESSRDLKGDAYFLSGMPRWTGGSKKYMGVEEFCVKTGETHFQVPNRIVSDFSGNKSIRTRATETGHCTEFTEHLLSVLSCADVGREMSD